LLAVVGDLCGDTLAKAYVNRAAALLQLGRVEESIADNTAAIELEPDDTDTLAKAYGNRAFALVELGRSEEAIADATAAIELEPDDTGRLALAYLNRAVALLQLGRSEEAIADATAATAPTRSTVAQTTTNARGVRSTNPARSSTSPAERSLSDQLDSRHFTL
jgi:tetratricopeptide (TPR) repeat protein